MKFMISVLTIFALAIAPALGVAQEQQQDPEKRRQGQAEREAVDTLTGCLTEQVGTFTLRTPAGESFSVTGSAELNKHKDHTVRITGKVSDEGGKKTLTVTKLEHVAPTCAN